MSILINTLLGIGNGGRKMKTMVFEKVSNRLKKEELNYIRGGDVTIPVGSQIKGDTENGDTYSGSSTWERDPNGDTRTIHFSFPTNGNTGSGSGVF
ncbi:MAG TPA: hypothetical protein VFF27_11435 [Bacteroidia bacterium]|jgi:hypothetical protein|nr:hypothetical protein [Bacteroidia bacterium]